jgi:N utilization substance protein B
MDEPVKRNNDGRPGNRRKARELALQALYALEIHGMEQWQTVFERIADGLFCAPDQKKYARDLVQATIESIGPIDERLARHAANWELKRMAALDRNILRLAVAELTGFPGVPYKVVIDEAVELAKLYGTDESGRFVNGIIDSVRREENRE